MITKLLIASALLSTFGGVAMVFANWDGATIGIVVAAAGTLVAAISSAIVAVVAAQTKSRQEIENTKAKNREAEMKLEMEKMRIQMEFQTRTSASNQHALQLLHTAVATNTVETIKGTVAADQAKQRVEQLEAKLPIPQSEVEDVTGHDKR